MAARHVIEEFHDTPVIDKGFYVLLGNNMFLYDLLKQGRKKEFKEAIAWWVTGVAGGRREAGQRGQRRTLEGQAQRERHGRQ